MTNVAEIKQFIIKLQTVIDKDADFTFFSKKYIKKNKIDDVLVCILATLPEPYKARMSLRGNTNRYPSIVCYKELFNLIKGKSKISSEHYVVQYKRAIDLIGAFLATFEKDLNLIEKEQ